jgi:hypothetical protein
MSGGKGGSTTSTVEVPQYIEDAAKENLARAQRISQIGYVPYYGPDVAAFSPQQEAAFAGTQQLAGAFGTPTASNIGVPAPQTFAGGTRGYSSAPMFEQAQFELGRRRPAQKAFIDSLFIDPYSGAYGSGAYVPPPIVIDDGPIDTTTDTSTTTTGTGTGISSTTIPPFTFTPTEVTRTDAAADLNLAIQPDADIFAATPEIIRESQAVLATDPTNPRYYDAFRNVYEYQLEQERLNPFGQVTGYGITPEILGQTGVEAFMPPTIGEGQIPEGSFTEDLTRSLTDPNYDPQGTVLSRALGDIFGSTSPQTQARLDAEIAARAAASENAAQRRESELNRAIAEVGGQELLDTGTQLAGDQTMALERQFGTLTTSDVVDQANLDQQSIPTGKGSLKDTRKVLDQAARDGNLGAYVDSFMDKYGGNLSAFQEKTGISSAVMKDIEKIAAAKG